MSAIDPANRSSIPRWLLAAAVGATILTASLALFATEWRVQRYLVFYLAPIVGMFPLWVRVRLLERRKWPERAVLVDGAVVVLALLRFVTGALPMSGHMLFFVHSGLSTRISWYRWLAAALALETTWFKLVLWADPWSWALGIGMGSVAAALHRLTMRGEAPID
jgi:hypothetical protein